jgi:cation:H+ antiporter
MDILKLISGFIILLISGRYLVVGGVNLAQTLKVSRLVIGVTVVSFGTSAPELLVSLQAALEGKPDIAMGNVIGSNISNIALVLAITAIILPIPVRSNSIKTDWPIMMGISVLLYFFVTNGTLDRIEGILFVAILIGFIIYSIYNSRKKDKELIDNETDVKKYPISITLLLLAASSVGLYFGSRWLVEGASSIAEILGVSDRVISITVVAFGTSVPELATSAIAAFRKETDISIGNIIGSNIFNIAGVLGITAAINPISISKELATYDIFWMLGISLMLFFLIIPLKGGILKRWKGIILLTIYILYVYLLFA